MRLPIPLLRAASLALLVFIAQPGLADTRQLLPSPEALIANTLEDIRASRLDSALKQVNKAISMRPDFKLAHLIKGDLLMARARPLSTLGAAPTGGIQPLSDLREEARLRLLRYLDQPGPDRLPRHLLQLAPDQRYALLADASRARIYLFENVDGEPRLLRDFYMTIGRNGVEKRVEGDKRTPIGVYTLSGQLPRNTLTDFYGSGAFPISYPNEWDRLQKRTGYGIWLHGTPPDTYSRPPRASDGCVVVTNPDLVELSQFIDDGTPVVLADQVEWLDRQAWETLRDEMLGKVRQWQRDWEAREADTFLRHYSATFLQAEGPSWAESKRRNIENKNWIRVSLSNLSLFLYPGEAMAVATFRQDYSSDRFNSSGDKRLYLRLDDQDQQWRIVLERSLDASKRVATTR